MNNLPKILAAVSMLLLVITVSSIFIASNLVFQRTWDARAESGAEIQSSGIGTYTASLIAAHSTPGDCWIAINDNVYNLTGFLVSHPGGALVMTPYCGRDGTNAYRTKDKNPAATHSQEADKLLLQYLLGPLASNQILPTTIPVTPSVPTITPKLTKNSAITSSQVAAHNTSADCWITISGKVYSVSPYLTIHPGGAAVIGLYCGRDATSAFQTKGKSPGISHSSYAQSLLSNYLVGGAAGFSAVPNAVPTQIPGSVSTPAPQTSTQTLSSSAVASHATSSDCWLIISSSVYNVTNYLAQHPGGVSAITPYCGKDGTGAFQTKGGQGSNHSGNAYSLLNNYLIGTLGSLVSVNPTTAPSNNPGTPASTSVPSGDCANLPAAICSKYPGAVRQSGKYEDSGSWEGKISVGGQCREIKVSSGGSVTEDHGC